MTSQDVEAYFNRLGERLSEAESLHVEPIPGPWVPKPRECHANVDYWITLEPGRLAVRGWIIDGTDGMAGFFVKAHSVGYGDGELHDITPADGNPLEPNAPRAFLRHEGTQEEFDELERLGSARFHGVSADWGHWGVEEAAEDWNS